MATRTLEWGEQTRRAMVADDIRRHIVHLTIVSDEGYCAECRQKGTPDRQTEEEDVFAGMYAAAGGDRGSLPAPTRSPFAYTTGLFERGLPEFAVVGLGPGDAARLLNAAARRVARDRRPVLAEDRLYLRGVLVQVDELANSGMIMLATHAYYDRSPLQPIPALQLTWSDRASRFPWEDGYRGAPQAPPGTWRA
ncbi:MAG: DUF4262 domain-containing protein [Actinomycetia bacterium]|nr:DUF4262 domain-containing protein [Actinomycetes bacterium]